MCDHWGDPSTDTRKARRWDEAHGNAGGVGTTHTDPPAVFSDYQKHSQSGLTSRPGQGSGWGWGAGGAGRSRPRWGLQGTVTLSSTPFSGHS